MTERPALGRRLFAEYLGTAILDNSNDRRIDIDDDAPGCRTTSPVSADGIRDRDVRRARGPLRPRRSLVADALRVLSVLPLHPCVEADTS